MAKTVFHSPSIGDTPSVARIVKAGNTLYINGLIGNDINGKVVGPGDMKAQADRVFERMMLALTDAGASVDDVVQMTVFVTDIGRISEVTEARNKYFPNGGIATTGIEIKALVTPDHVIEVNGVAVV